jgi:hypothetical protein
VDCRTVIGLGAIQQSRDQSLAATVKSASWTSVYDFWRFPNFRPWSVGPVGCRTDNVSTAHVGAATPDGDRGRVNDRCAGGTAGDVSHSPNRNPTIVTASGAESLPMPCKFYNVGSTPQLPHVHRDGSVSAARVSFHVRHHRENTGGGSPPVPRRRAHVPSTQTAVRLRAFRRRHRPIPYEPASTVPISTRAPGSGVGVGSP